MKRRFAIAGYACLGLLSGIGALAESPSEARLSYKWIVPESLVGDLRKDLKHSGPVEHEKDAKGLPLVAIIIGVALLPNLVDSIMKLRAKLIQPGLIVDTRQVTIQIETSSKVPKGFILLVSKDGSNLIDSAQLKDSSELAKALASAVAK